MNNQILNDEALDLVIGGTPKGYDGCTAGGGTGLYPTYVCDAPYVSTIIKDGLAIALGTKGK